MARPPDGSSTWHHTADCHVLLDADGTTWARVHQPLAGGSLQLSLPYAGRKLDAYRLRPRTNVVAVGFAFPTDAGTRIETHATSLP